MNRTARDELSQRLLAANIDSHDVARAGGGIWCFGSRASSCERNDSDWDVLVISNERSMRRRLRHESLDICYVELRDLGKWGGTELATHVEAFGVRIDHGRPGRPATGRLFEAVDGNRGSVDNRRGWAGEEVDYGRDLLRLGPSHIVCVGESGPSGRRVDHRRHDRVGQTSWPSIKASRPMSREMFAISSLKKLQSKELI